MNFLDEVTCYSRKDYKAEVRLMAIDGQSIKNEWNQCVELIKNTLWSQYTEIPKFLYAVFDTTTDKRFGRGYIFYVRYQWSLIVRVNDDRYVCPHPTLDSIPAWEPWCRTPAEAAARVIRQSRKCWGKTNYQEPTKPIASTPIWQSDDYRILGLPRSFTKIQLTHAYRQLCFKYHPDTGDGNRQKLEAVISAYKRLKHLVK